MTRRRFDLVLFAGVALIALTAISSGRRLLDQRHETAPDAGKAAEPLAIATAAVESRSIDRYLRVTGSLDGRRAGGSQRRNRRPRHRDAGRARHARRAGRAARPHLAVGDRRRSCRKRTPTPRRSKRGSGSSPASRSIRMRVPDVMNAKASLDLAEAEFNRMRSLARSEGHLAERVRPAAHAARGRAPAVSDGAERRRSVVSLARRRRAPASRSRARRWPTRRSARRSPASSPSGSSASATTSRAAQRVATVVRIDPLRVELTVPEQHVSLIKVGQQVRLTVDAYPGEEFAATVRFVSPSLRSDQRALTVEAIAPNADGRLKPGLFATALVRQPDAAPALLVPATAVETVAGTSRVYVVKDDTRRGADRHARREASTPQVEITTGVRQGRRRRRRAEGPLADGAGQRADGQQSRPVSDRSPFMIRVSYFMRSRHAVARFNLRSPSGLRDASSSSR